MYKGFMHCTMKLSVNEAKLVCASGTGLLLGPKIYRTFRGTGPWPRNRWLLLSLLSCKAWESGINGVSLLKRWDSLTIDHFAVVDLPYPSLPVNVRLRLTLFWYKPYLLRYGNCPWKILVSIREQLDLHNKAGRFVSKQGHLQPRFHP